jgi:hypothetical protein
MRFFLVARDPDTGMVRLIDEGTFAVRQDALDVLGPAVDKDASLAESDLFLVDLDQIAPVVLYRAAAPVVTAEEPLADAWMTPAEAAVADAVVEDAVLDAAEPLWVPDKTIAAPVSDGGDLADALRRAASRLESEGIVAPPSVEEFAAQTVTESPVLTAPWGDTSLETGEPSSAPIEEPSAGTSEPATTSTENVSVLPEPWPWESSDREDGAEAGVDVAVVAVADEAFAGASAEEAAVAESVDLESALALPVFGPEGVGARDDAGVFEPVGIDEAGLEDVQLLTPIGDLAPHPLIVGEYAPSATADADDLTLAEIEALAAGIESSSDTVDEDVADSTVGLVESEPVEPVLDAGASTDDSATDDKAYEPGRLDIAAYTCDDCVYVDTCPKARQDGPATCGSFQWKSV